MPWHNSCRSVSLGKCEEYRKAKYIGWPWCFLCSVFFPRWWHAQSTPSPRWTHFTDITLSKSYTVTIMGWQLCTRRISINKILPYLLKMTHEQPRKASEYVRNGSEPYLLHKYLRQFSLIRACQRKCAANHIDTARRYGEEPWAVLVTIIMTVVSYWSAHGEG